MKRIFRFIRWYFIIIIPLINIYIFLPILLESNNGRAGAQSYISSWLADSTTTNKSSNEFLVLDWTANQHIFQEPDILPCDFSSHTVEYCEKQFRSISDEKSRLNSIERCVRLANITVRWTKDRSKRKQVHLMAYHAQHLPAYRQRPPLYPNQYSMVYTLESEAWDSSNSWTQIDFAMWYNLERSYPEPATYFDVFNYLRFLLAPVQIPFQEKVSTSIAIWISSNCHTFNGRERFVEELMHYIPIDSFGKCLHNRPNQTIVDHHRENNIALYASYKFVIAIENSNCEDYVTEKLIEAIAAGSIPIVASRNDTPNYLRFAPEHSLINVYDFASVEDLALYLNYLSSNQTAYEEYFWFRQSMESLSQYNLINLDDYLALAQTIFGADSMIYRWLLTKESSMNKYCKVVRFIHMNDRENITNHRTQARPSASEVCLPHHDLISSFNLS